MTSYPLNPKHPQAIPPSKPEHLQEKALQSRLQVVETGLLLDRVLATWTLKLETYVDNSGLRIALVLSRRVQSLFYMLKAAGDLLANRIVAGWSATLHCAEVKV